MTKEDQLIAIKASWHWYLLKGGISEPLNEDNIGVLRRGGLEAWASLLRTAKEYIVKYPRERGVLEGFLPRKLVKMIVGE